MPAGRTDASLPFGVTFIAPAQLDAALARLGAQWCDESGAAALAALATPATQAVLPLAVVGAHLSGLPLNGQLLERGATLLQVTTTAPAYKLYALPGTLPPKPGLQRVAEGGGAIAVEVWALPQAAVGSFLALIPPPLGLGSIELADGRQDHTPYIDAAAATLGLKITGEQRPGVTRFFTLAADMAALVNGLALTPADESGQVFTPVSPDLGEGAP